MNKDINALRNEVRRARYRGKREDEMVEKEKNWKMGGNNDGKMK